LNGLNPSLFVGNLANAYAISRSKVLNCSEREKLRGELILTWVCVSDRRDLWVRYWRSLIFEVSHSHRGFSPVIGKRATQAAVSTAFAQTSKENR